MYCRVVKHWLDRLIALIVLVMAFPVFCSVAMLIWIRLGSPVFFTQRRPGYRSRIFTIYKFRTMSNERDDKGELLSDEARLTGVGKAIRTLSLDELPQLYNVLRGDMSFIGPRPLLVEYLTLYSETQKKRHDVRPGISGWAQINGRNAISWQQKFELDVYYVQHCSVRLDLKITWLTIKKVFKREGIAAEGRATVEKFNGHN